MISTISVASLGRLIAGETEYAIIDVREEGQFVAAHLLRATSIPLGRFEVSVAARLPCRKCCVVLCDADGASEAVEAARLLDSWGHVDVRTLEGGLEACRAEGFPIYSGMHTPSKAFGEAIEVALETPAVSAQQLAREREGPNPPVVIDCRPHAEYLTGSLPGSINVPGVELMYRIDKVVTDPDVAVVVHCAGRTRSIIGAQSLRDAGITNPVRALENGTMGWLLAGFETALPDAPASGFDGAPIGLESKLALARSVREQRGIPLVSSSQVAQWCAEPSDTTTYVADVRTHDEYVEGQASWAMHAPGGQLLQATDKYLAVQNAKLVVCDDNGVRASVVAGWLKRMGWRDVAVWPMSGAPGRWVTGPETTVYWSSRQTNVRSIAAAELAKRVDAGDLDVVDIDTSLEYEKGHLPGAVFIKRRSLDRFLASLDPGRQVVVTSSDGITARLAAMASESADRLMVLTGGKIAWKARGHAMNQGPESLFDTPDDVWRRPVDAPGDRVQNMQQYLSWEIGLMEQIKQDKSVRFSI